MFEELVMWSDAPESIIHGVDLKQQDRAYNSLPVCAKETLEVPDVKLDFSNARRCSIFFVTLSSPCRISPSLRVNFKEL